MKGSDCSCKQICLGGHDLSGLHVLKYAYLIQMIWLAFKWVVFWLPKFIICLGTLTLFHLYFLISQPISNFTWHVFWKKFCMAWFCDNQCFVTSCTHRSLVCVRKTGFVPKGYWSHLFFLKKRTHNNRLAVDWYFHWNIYVYKGRN